MSDRLHCPGCGIPTIEGGLDTTEEELYCNRCVEEIERNMSTNKPAGGAQFTPGPWRVDGEGMQVYKDKQPIAVIRTVFDENGGRVTREANTALIAAAPALYAALREAEKHLTDLANYGSEGIPEPLLVSVRSAIAQAEGE